MVNRLYIILNDFADLSAIEISSHTLVAAAYSLSSGERVADVVYVYPLGLNVSHQTFNTFAMPSRLQATRVVVRSEVAKEL